MTLNNKELPSIVHWMSILRRHGLDFPAVFMAKFFIHIASALWHYNEMLYGDGSFASKQ